MSARARLTPQMVDYQGKFADDGEVRWLPHLVYFHPSGHRSRVVNTDSSGFRYSEAGGVRYSAADPHPRDRVRVIAGSSTVFGIGAASDAATLSSRLSARDERGEPWVNFGGRSFNSTQELLLFTLYRHLLPDIEEIVLFSGFNNLGLARQPAAARGEHGAFFLCNQYFDALGVDAYGDRLPRRSPLDRLVGRREPAAEAPMELAAQVEFAAALTLRHLDTWRALAADSGARLTFVLQPLAAWVRATGSAEEEALFAELDRLGDFRATYGDILDPAVHADYARRVEQGAKGMGVGFLDLAPLLADAVRPDEWIFVDRIHFTDHGHDVVARLLVDHLTA